MASRDTVIGILAAFSTVSLILSWHYVHKLQVRFSLQNTILNRSAPRKIILFWNDDWLFMRQSPRVVLKDDLNCPERCILTTDRNSLRQSSAVVFNANILDRNAMPKIRFPWQYWIFFTHESPCYFANNGTKWEQLYSVCEEFGFNLTMTYHTASDIFMPYGRVQKRTLLNKKDFVAIAKSKTKLIAWIVSNCDTFSMREKYVKELSKYVDIDVYGKCGTLKCPKTYWQDHWEMNSPCMQMVNQTYKFYLGFENRFSEDYITEKFWRSAALDLIVIARSAADYEKFHIPSNWFLNTDNFKSPKELAEHVKYLDRHPEFYAQYLEWKNSYDVQVFPPAKRPAWCDLCKKLHNQHIKKTLTRADIMKIYSKTDCKRPQDLNFLSENERNNLAWIEFNSNNQNHEFEEIRS